MQEFGVREVEKLLRLPRSTIRVLVEAGFVTPSRGPRNSLRFSFQDLIVLRTAQALAAARVPAKRINRSLKALRRHLPAAMPLSGLRVDAVGDRVVVREGASRWQADSGQYLLMFEGDPAAGALKVVEREIPREPVEKDPVALYNLGVRLEEMGRKLEALEAYKAALQEDPRMADCCYNLGLLCEELKRPREAIRYMAQYRRLVKIP
ncbi:MAG: tetratricopeptide repeat protein [Burkholderiales bacterium]